jgi:hypothetical protein
VINDKDEHSEKQCSSKDVTEFGIGNDIMKNIQENNSQQDKILNLAL